MATLMAEALMVTAMAEVKRKVTVTLMLREANPMNMKKNR